MPESILKNVLAGIHCRIAFDWDEGRADTEFSLSRVTPYELVQDSAIGLVSLREGWPIRIKTNLTSASRSGAVSTQAERIRDLICLYVLARVEQYEPNLLQFMPPLPPSLLIPSWDPDFIFEELSLADDAWHEIAKAKQVQYQCERRYAGSLRSWSAPPGKPS